MQYKGFYTISALEVVSQEPLAHTLLNTHATHTHIHTLTHTRTHTHTHTHTQTHTLRLRSGDEGSAKKH